MKSPRLVSCSLCPRNAQLSEKVSPGAGRLTLNTLRLSGNLSFAFKFCGMVLMDMMVLLLSMPSGTEKMDCVSLESPSA